MFLIAIQLITLATRANLGAAKRCNSPKDDQAMTTKTKAPSEALLLEIAAKHFHLETLETRNSDSLDFHDVSVWSIRAALEAAFAAGQATAR
ncbi:hypothetical protein OAN307_c45070 [Octadecabacter antarcticus 307]|uniref:DUF6900 domain-containing protein n=2 Tax=Octadecabacter TaxID=53945 RepID=M9RB78_9RHOB|nr:hypothetical protein OAN307_c45070 [Octadecabacter antarcticus 307]